MSLFDWVNYLPILRPEQLLWLVPIAIVIYLLYKYPFKQNSLDNIIDPELLPHLLANTSIHKNVGVKKSKSFKNILKKYLIKQSRLSDKLFLTLLVTMLLTFVLSIAGWKGERTTESGLVNNQNTLIVLDTSWFMKGTDIIPNRLQRAKFKIQDFLNQNKEHSVGLIAFTDTAYVINPFTKDDATILNFLEALDPSIMPSNGYNLKTALDLAFRVLDESTSSLNNILIITSYIPKTQITPVNKTISNYAARSDAEAQIAILSIGEGGAFIDNNGAFLKNSSGELIKAPYIKENSIAIAQANNSLWQQITNTDDDIKNISVFFKRSSPIWSSEDNLFNSWSDYGPYLIFLIIFILLILFHFKSSLFFNTIIIAVFFKIISANLLFIPYNSYAQSLPNINQRISNENSQDNLFTQFLYKLFFTPDQRAMMAYNEENFSTAKRLFQNHNWQALSALRAKDYTLAERLWREENTQESTYNLGLALANQGRLHEAVQVFEGLVDSPETSLLIQIKAKKNMDLINAFLNTPRDTNNSDQNDEDSKANSPPSASSDSQSNQPSPDTDLQRDNSSNTEDEPEIRPNLSDTSQGESNQPPPSISNENTLSNQNNDNENYDETPNFHIQQLESLNTNPANLLRRKLFIEYNRQYSNISSATSTFE